MYLIQIFSVKQRAFTDLDGDQLAPLYHS